ncbi:hypothetical protein LQG66_00085 [Bradyrhizobium ontarionense]|uniref:Uncharacterized protein n=1 Tax=Bradyrhizobium ontarionense TaxID=2898149 RepID=A0ABY3RCR4_9BRAD|nr:hypothetical protein [Bradyrhizobium sp. A19]UFZ04767.1 hypothetical protein LQG66_00085 [Bradyrhizobium sp. A19]
MTDVRSGLFNHAVLKSLDKIRAAKSRFNRLTSGNPTQAALMSQIELCDALLDEIRLISSSLEKRVENRSVVSRRPMATRRQRGASHRIAPCRDVPGRTKQRK